MPTYAGQHMPMFLGASRGTRHPSAIEATGWPNASNTGVPAGTTLTAYSGSLTITTPGTVIDSKNITGQLVIAADNVTIQNCYIYGGCQNADDVPNRSFLIKDCEINAGDAAGTQTLDGTALANRDFTALRCHIYGGKRSIQAWLNVWVEDCYCHGQAPDPTGTYHESGIRMGAGATLIHNTIVCDAPEFPPEAGCSADLTGYGDFAVVENNLIQNNWFGATESGGFCAYGGSAASKPFPDANNIRFIDNVFERGASGTCGVFGPITGFDVAQPGNVWTNNRWDDGGTVPPSL